MTGRFTARISFGSSKPPEASRSPESRRCQSSQFGQEEPVVGVCFGDHRLSYQASSRGLRTHIHLCLECASTPVKLLLTLLFCQLAQ